MSLVLLQHSLLVWIASSTSNLAATLDEIFRPINWLSAAGVCKSYLEEIGGLPANVEDQDAPYFAEYNYLRSRLRTHINNQMTPEVSLLPSPTGGAQAFIKALRAEGIIERDSDVESGPEEDDDL
jgi:hypothetical protein